MNSIYSLSLWCSILSNLYYFKLILNNIFRLHETLIYASNILLSSDCHLLQDGPVSCFLRRASRNFLKQSQVFTVLYCTVYFIFAHTLTIIAKHKRRCDRHFSFCNHKTARLTPRKL